MARARARARQIECPLPSTLRDEEVSALALASLLFTQVPVPPVTCD